MIVKLKDNLNPSDLVFNELKSGIEYKVIGIITYVDTSSIKLFISPFENDYFPREFSLDLFEIISNKLSKYWVFNYRKDESNGNIIELVFEDWTKVDNYMMNFIESEHESFSLYFEKYKELIFNEPD